MEIQILNPEYVKVIREDELLMAKIAKATDRKISSIKRWLEDNDELLTTATVLNVIREHLSLPQTALLTTTAQTA